MVGYVFHESFANHSMIVKDQNLLFREECKSDLAWHNIL